MTEKRFSKVDRAKNFTKVALTTGALATAGLIAGCGAQDRKVSLNTAKQEAMSKYGTTFSHTSDAGKFALQFLGNDSIRQLKESSNSNGDNIQWVLHFNNGCLYNTAYDTEGGHIIVNGSVGGLFVGGWVKGKGNIPATAIVSQDPASANMIDVIPGGSRIPTLEFTGALGDGPLEPANNATKGILAANNCQFGITRVSTIDIDQSY